MTVFMRSVPRVPQLGHTPIWRVVITADKKRIA
jgi:hypothetical protein